MIVAVIEKQVKSRNAKPTVGSCPSAMQPFTPIYDMPTNMNTKTSIVVRTTCGIHMLSVENYTARRGGRANNVK